MIAKNAKSERQGQTTPGQCFAHFDAMQHVEQTLHGRGW
jgi:hypothetical protein